MQVVFLTYFLLLPVAASAAQTICEITPTPEGIPLGEHSSLTVRQHTFPRLQTTFAYRQLPTEASPSIKTTITSTKELTFHDTPLTQARHLLVANKPLFEKLIGHNYPDGYLPIDAAMYCHPVQIEDLEARMKKFLTQTTSAAPSAAKESLLRAQEQWSSYRNATCSALKIAAHTYDGAEEDCIITLTEARIAEILREHHLFTTTWPPGH